MKSWDIVGYIYQGDVYCTACVLGQVLHPHEEYIDQYDTESALDRLSYVRGVDREAERTFDSDDFPKVGFADQATTDDVCGNCLQPLL
jgi:hypothetical protein